MGDPDYGATMNEVARRLLGIPNKHLSSDRDLRFGRNGSISVAIAGEKAGTWYDHEHQVGGGVLDLVRHKGIVDPVEWLREIDGDRHRSGSRDVVRYAYHGADGEVLFWVCRIGHGKGKRFWQEQPGPSKGGIMRDTRGKPTMRGVKLVPYHLPEILEARRNRNGHPPLVHVCEGEKDCDRVQQDWGLLTTTNPGGVGKWHHSYSSHLAGCDVVILGDNDDAGRAHVEQVAGSLARHAASIRIVRLSGLRNKGDISDWIDAGGTQSDFETLVELAEPLPQPSPPSSDEEVVAQSLADIAVSRISWLWQGHIARGKLVLFAGHPGLGKSHVGLYVAAILSNGGTWPDGSTAPQGCVIVLSAEDDAGDTLKPRLLALGADQHRVHVLHAVRDVDDRGHPIERGFSLVDDTDRLAAMIERIGNVVAIVVDPLTAYLGDIDGHKTVEVRAVLRPLAALAAKYQLAVVGITHLRKSPDGDAVLLVTGSLAFVAAARAVYYVIKDGAVPKRRLVLPVKNNLARDTSGWAYTIEPATVADGIPTSCLVWEPDPVDGTADDELQRQRASDRQKPGPKAGTARKMEADFLRTVLADGPVNVFDIKRQATDAGLSWRTVERAAKDIGIITRKLGFADGWAWELPS